MSTAQITRAGGPTGVSPGTINPLKGAVIAMMAILILMIGYRTYQGMFAWSAGLDATTAEFDRIWMGLLQYELIGIFVSWVALWSYLLWTRDKNLDALQPKEEVKRYFNLVMFIFVYAFAVYWGASFFGEQDAAWHQVAVRDTSFTPSHIVLFYGAMPFYVLFGVGSLLYAMTRLPKFAARISIPLVLAVAGPFMILPNLGFNEWGHAFWMLEEVFTAPLHWGFVILGWSVLALGGLLLQIMGHLNELFKKIEDAESVAA